MCLGGEEFESRVFFSKTREKGDGSGCGELRERNQKQRSPPEKREKERKREKVKKCREDREKKKRQNKPPGKKRPWCPPAAYFPRASVGFLSFLFLHLHSNEEASLREKERTKVDSRTGVNPKTRDGRNRK